MKHYFNVYKKFVEASITEAISFRTSFVLLIIMDLVFFAVTLMTVDFLYDHITKIGPWTRIELMFFVSFMLVIDQVHMTVLSENFWMLSRKIKLGELDFDLLRPISSLFICFFRFFRPASFLLIFLAVGLLINYGLLLELSLGQWLFLPIGLLLALILKAVIEFLISISMFYVVEGFGINFLRMQIQQISRWPDFIYRNPFRRIFTFILPITLIGSAPVKFLILPDKKYLLAVMLFAILVLIFMLKISWNFALKKYESASS